MSVLYEENNETESLKPRHGRWNICLVHIRIHKVPELFEKDTLCNNFMIYL